MREGDTVVDLGSGAGIDLLIAARAVGPEGRVIGVDMTDEMIAKACAHVAKAGVTNVEVRKGLVEVEVKDRLVYETSQIAGIVESELPEVLENLTKDGVPIDREQLRTLAGSVEGKVMSLKIAARKA